MKPIMNRKEGNQPITYDVYVGNVPKNISEEDLKQLFRKFGEVYNVLCRWKEDYFGYGIVKFTHKRDADRVLQNVADVNLNGHTMPVKTARRSEHSNQNGNSVVDNKPKFYSDMNKNQISCGSNFSNTDYGHFQYPPPPSINEQVIRPQSSHPIQLDVLCTSVENPVTFYGSPVNRSEDLMLISSSLNEFSYNFTPLDTRPSLKRMYAALFSEDTKWYRCTVVKNSLPNKPQMCSVRYIDYGNQEEIRYQNIVEIPESLHKIPPIASKFTLAHLVYDPKLNSKKSYLHQLVNKRMTLSARLSQNMEYQVFWCSCNGKDVIADIISKGFAKLVRPESSNLESNSKARAYSCGGDKKVPSSNDSHASSLYIPKAVESPVVNGIGNNKKTLKSQCKSKEGSPKNEEDFCNGTFEEVKKDEDFHPKRIIKRGSELGDIVRKNSSDTLSKEKDSNQPAVCTLDSVHPNLKFINNIRSLVSQSSDDSIISCAVELLKNEISTIVHSEASIKNVVSASEIYWGSVKNLKKIIQERLKMCTEVGSSASFEEELSNLKSTRDSSRVDLFNKLKDYLGSCDSSIFQRKEKIQKIITDLESNSNAWMNVQLPRKPETIDELIQEYHKVKEERWSLVSTTRAKTEKAHQEFDNVLSTIQKEFHLNTLKENEVSNLSPNVYNIAKTTSFDDQLKNVLTVFGNALEEEIQTLTVNKDSGNHSVIQCLLDILDVHKEKIDELCDHYENHYAVYNDLNKLPDIENTLKELESAKEEVHGLKEELSFKEASTDGDFQSEISNLRRQLHRALLKEDSLKAILAKASESHFPELCIEVPHLNLLNYLETKLLLKDWRPSYFLNFGNTHRGESSYVSCLHDEPVTIKEYSFENAENCNAFVRKAVQWNEIRSDYIVKIKALFYKDEKTILVMLPPVPNTILRSVPHTSPGDGEKACRFLRHVLIGLKDIHSAGLVHHAIHPTSIVIENEKALIDFCFDANFLNGKENIKGINFLPPENKSTHESADMYGFGCLVLWVLFPNLSLTPAECGVPNIDAFRSIIQELILPKDYSFLSSLIDANPERRPSSCTLLSKGFLSKYEAYCRSRCDTPKSASM